MNIFRPMLFVSVPALLAGCMAVPVAPDYYAGAYDPYASPPVYYAPMPLYIAPPIYRHHSFGCGSHGGKRGSGHGHGHGHGHR